MPSSRIDGIESFVKRLMKEKPKTILDVGCGFGKYGFLCREYLDIWDSSYPYKERRTTIDAIEAYPSYIRDLQEFIYDNVSIMDASKIPWYLGEYDLIILSDVLEHTDNGLDILDYAISISNLVYLKIPINVMTQGEIYGNKHEKHIQGIVPSELSQRGELEICDKFYVMWIQ